MTRERERESGHRESMVERVVVDEREKLGEIDR